MNQISHVIKNNQIVLNNKNSSILSGKTLDKPRDPYPLLNIKIRSRFIKNIKISLFKNSGSNSNTLATFFMGMGRYPLESLAVLPVINSLVFIFRTPGLSYQETAITMLGRSPINRRPVLSFATLLGAAAAIRLLLIVWTPLAAVWLQRISGLDASLAEFAIRPLRILGLMPALSVLLSLQRSLLVHRRQTEPITWASLLEVGGILTVLAWAILIGDWVGATAAAAAFMVGRTLANGYLLRYMKLR